jgi:membrane protease YdiL (CAAX protease family)
MSPFQPQLRSKSGGMKKRPLVAYLTLVTLLSCGFVYGMWQLGQSGHYLAGAYMFSPAVAALITRLFFHERGFQDAHLGPGKPRHYLRFWGFALAIVALSFVMYTLLGAISWDFSGDTFLVQLREQMALSGRDIADLPAGLTPKTTLFLFLIGGLTLFNIPMTIVGFGEEFGWRGILFPQLCRRHLVPGLIVGGLIWFAWHVPLTLIMPESAPSGPWERAGNTLVLAIGSILTFVFLSYVYARSGSIWVASFVHAVINNGSRSFAYFAVVQNQLLANVGLALAMLAAVVLLHVRKELKVLGEFLTRGSRSGLILDRPGTAPASAAKTTSSG